MKISKRVALALGALLTGAILVPTVVNARGGGRGGGRGKGRGGKEYKDRKALIGEMEEQMRVSDREGRFADGRGRDAREVRDAGLDASLGDLRRTGEDARRDATARVETPH